MSIQMKPSRVILNTKKHFQKCSISGLFHQRKVFRKVIHMFKYPESKQKYDVKWFLNQNTLQKKKKVCILPHKRNLDHRNTEVGRDLGKSPTQPQSRVSYQRWGVIEAHPTSLYPDRPNTEDGNVQCTECSSVH